MVGIMKNKILILLMLILCSCKNQNTEPKFSSASWFSIGDKVYKNAVVKSYEMSSLYFFKDSVYVNGTPLYF